MHNKKTLIILAAFSLFFSTQSYSEVEKILTPQEESAIISKINEKKSHSEKMKVIYNSGRELVAFNYVKNKKEAIKRPGDLTPEEGVEYVPQTDEFIELYLNSLVDDGLLPIEAIVDVHVSEKGLALLKKYKKYVAENQ